MFKKGITYFILGAALMLWIWLFFSKSSIAEYQTVEVVKTDTVYVDRPYKQVVIKEVEIEKPVKFFIYKTDTIYRERLEKDTLISAIEIKPKLATIHTITPTGIPLVKEYFLQPYKEIQIDHEGNLKLNRKKQRRKKLWRNLERISILIGGVLVGRKIK